MPGLDVLAVEPVRDAELHPPDQLGRVVDRIGELFDVRLLGLELEYKCGVFGGEGVLAPEYAVE